MPGEEHPRTFCLCRSLRTLPDLTLRVLLEPRTLPALLLDRTLRRDLLIRTRRCLLGGILSMLRRERDLRRTCPPAILVHRLYTK